MPLRESDFRRQNRREEQSTVNAILEYLTLRGVPHYRTTNVGSIYHKDGQVHFGKKQISQVGAPDIFAWWKGQAYAIEVKSQEGQLTKEQTEWLWRFQERGQGSVVVAKSLDDVLAVFGSGNW